MTLGRQITVPGDDGLNSQLANRNLAEVRHLNGLEGSQTAAKSE